ncbi:MAG: AAA family ATPase [Holophagaceae bacterium]|nr:AAA family ATPase [Holophagaceae bacterium]
MDTIRIKNFRSLIDTGEVPLKPINILIGKNSSGKSSFLRIFALLKQSFETVGSSPILWYGKLVDFGDYDTAINKENTLGGIEFSFSICLKRRDITPIHVYAQQALEFRNQDIVISYSATINRRSDLVTGGSYLSKCTIKIFDLTVELEFDENGLVSKYDIDGLNYLEFTNSTFENSASSLIPMLSEQVRGEEDVNKQSKSTEDKIVELFAGLVHGRTSRGKILFNFKRMYLDYKPVMKLNFIDLFSNNNREKLSNQFDAYGKRVDKIRRLKMGYELNRLFIGLNSALNRFSNDCFYIGPSRAMANRYYRQAELAVNEVDYRGENLVMYLKSMTKAQQDSLTKFAQGIFSFSIALESQFGHSAIKVGKGSTPEFNLVDLGFGYSQLLPVIVQMWHAIHRVTKLQGLVETPRRSTRVLCVEQPELHLHPSMQALLADLMVATLVEAKEQNVPVVNIFETHSEYLINRLGYLINEGKLDPEHVQILVFENSDDGHRTQIETSKFDSNGALVNWPYGFFLGW